MTFRVSPAVARFLLAISSAAKRSALYSSPTILAVSWVDYAHDATTWFEDCLPVGIKPHQVRHKLASLYRGVMSDADIDKIVETYSDDIFLLRLSLDQSREHHNQVGPADLAEYVWTKRTHDSGVDTTEAIRITLVVGSLGRFDIPTPPSFLLREACTSEVAVRNLHRTGLLRRHRANISMGHRSLCGLLSDWLEWKGGWQSLDLLCGPRGMGNVVLDYLRSLGSSLAVDSLRALQARAGFKDRPNLNHRAAALVELWEALTQSLNASSINKVSIPHGEMFLPLPCLQLKHFPKWERWKSLKRVWHFYGDIGRLLKES